MATGPGVDGKKAEKPVHRGRRLVKRLVLGLGLLGLVLVTAHYGKAVVRTFGLTSPLSRNFTLIRFIVGQEVQNDLRRVQWHVDRLRNRSGSQNYYTAEMIQVSRDDVTAGRFERPAAPDVVIKGKIHDLAGAAAGTVDGPIADSGPVARPDLLLPSGDDWARKRSDLVRITTANVADLKLEHVVDAAAALGGAWVHNAEAAPLNWGGFVYWLSAEEQIVSVDVKSGAIRWHFKLPHFDYAQRGFLLRERSGGGATLYVPFGQFIAGDRRRVGQAAERLWGRRRAEARRHQLQPGRLGRRAARGRLRRHHRGRRHLETGRPHWSVPLHGEHHNFQGAVPWSGMAIDRARDLLFISTGNPRPALSGITRPGDNNNSDSVIAIDLHARKIEWAFQEVRHDLWDYDVPSSPMLTRINVEHHAYDVVIAVTKIGNTLILNRETGQPIFDFRLKQAPASLYAKEQTSRYQPAVETPEPLSSITFDPSMVTDISPESQRFINHAVGEGRAVYGWFHPPELNRDLVVFGVHGGAEWPGASIDPEQDRLYTAVNVSPYVLRIYLTAAAAYKFEDAAGPAAQALYMNRCASCHLATREGQYEGVGEQATVRSPRSTATRCSLTTSGCSSRRASARTTRRSTFPSRTSTPSGSCSSAGTPTCSRRASPPSPSTGTSSSTRTACPAPSRPGGRSRRSISRTARSCGRSRSERR